MDRSRNHAAFEHLVQHGCGNLIDEGHSCFRIAAQQIQCYLLLLRWRLCLLRLQLIAACCLVFLITLSAASSTSMPWAATAPATISAEPNTATPNDLFTLRSSSYCWSRVFEGRRCEGGD